MIDGLVDALILTWMAVWRLAAAGLFGFLVSEAMRGFAHWAFVPPLEMTPQAQAIVGFCVFLGAFNLLCQTPKGDSR